MLKYQSATSCDTFLSYADMSLHELFIVVLIPKSSLLETDLHYFYMKQSICLGESKYSSRLYKCKQKIMLKLYDRIKKTEWNETLL